MHILTPLSDLSVYIVDYVDLQTNQQMIAILLIWVSQDLNIWS